MSEPAQAISHAESTPDGTTESLPEAEVDDLQREIQGSSSRPRTIKTTIGALALGSAIAATSPSPASAAEFTAVDLYHICSAGMDVHSDINHSQACFNFLGQVWGRGVVAGEICSVNPVNNIQMAMTFTTGLWRLAPEYLSQRADIGAAAVRGARQAFNGGFSDAQDASALFT